MGGAAFTLTMLWAQVMPFVALHLYENDDEGDVGAFSRENLQIFLMCSFVLWLLTTVAFFYTIDSSYFYTFWGTMTAPQFACKSFKDASEDSVRFDKAFRTRTSFTKSIHGEVKEWVAANIDQWRDENPDWFDIKQIPDEFLPAAVVVEEGGACRRRRSSVSLRELVGGGESK